MKLREIIGASALALLTSAAGAQSLTANSSTSPSGLAAGVTMPALSAAESNDPIVQKRMEDKAARKEYKAEKKAAKNNYKQDKKHAKAKLKQDMAAQPAKPGELAQPGEYGQPAAGTAK